MYFEASQYIFLSFFCVVFGFICVNDPEEKEHRSLKYNLCLNTDTNTLTGAFHSCLVSFVQELRVSVKTCCLCATLPHFPA